MSLLDKMKISDRLDDDAMLPEEEQDDRKRKESEKEKYMDFYDDVKQPSKYIKEDW